MLPFIGSLFKKGGKQMKKCIETTAITLIALIITIIVLLILAGVSLNMVMGENGIINKAQLAKEKTNEAQKDENVKIKELEEIGIGVSFDEGAFNDYAIIPDRAGFRIQLNNH